MHDTQGLLLERKLLPHGVEGLRLLTPDYGVIFGVHSPNVRCAYAVGNLLHVRVVQYKTDTLCKLQVDLAHAYAAQALLQGRIAIVGIQLVCDTLQQYMPENAPLALNLYQKILHLINIYAKYSANLWILQQHALWEKDFLHNTGYIGQTDCCYMAECVEPVYYLSPKTGNGACKIHGARWHALLLKYPPLWQQETNITAQHWHIHKTTIMRLWRLVPTYRRTALYVTQGLYDKAIQADFFTSQSPI